ncbi:proline-rich protein HaeIII subfamily 1-like [Myotis yumanensis]|uniref:proline-rich protein HaeIII subfamily 1-like n=1 Tax=Myotis yumanensis TaxID=159337 RepID=UPI0038D414EB
MAFLIETADLGRPLQTGLGDLLSLCRSDWAGNGLREHQPPPGGNALKSPEAASVPGPALPAVPRRPRLRPQPAQRQVWRCDRSPGLFARSPVITAPRARAAQCDAEALWPRQDPVPTDALWSCSQTSCRVDTAFGQRLSPGALLLPIPTQRDRPPSAPPGRPAGDPFAPPGRPWLPDSPPPRSRTPRLPDAPPRAPRTPPAPGRPAPRPQDVPGSRTPRPAPPGCPWLPDSPPPRSRTPRAPGRPGSRTPCPAPPGRPWLPDAPPRAPRTPPALGLPAPRGPQPRGLFPPPLRARLLREPQASLRAADPLRSQILQDFVPGNHRVSLSDALPETAAGANTHDPPEPRQQREQLPGPVA